MPAVAVVSGVVLLWTRPGAGAGWGVVGFGLLLVVLAEPAVERAALEKDGGANPRAVVNRISLDVEDDAGERRSCRGYAHIEGDRLTRYLDGKCLRPVAITPTGEVWAFGTNRNRKKAGIFIITPDR